MAGVRAYSGLRGRQPIVEARNVVKEHGGKVVINSVSLAVEEGSRLIISGPSGCGKTTFLNILGCIERPTKGAVFVRGRNVSSRGSLDSVRRENFGFVFQSSVLIPELSGLENVALPGLVGGRPASVVYRRARELLEAFKIYPRSSSTRNSLVRRIGPNKKAFQEQKSWQYSGGEKQRVAIARALINDPRVILADEPTGNLDQELTKEVINHLCKGKMTRGRAVVVVTHDPWVMKYGEDNNYWNCRVQEDGTLLSSAPVDRAIRAVRAPSRAQKN